jgi:hypothetical protein
MGQPVKAKTEKAEYQRRIILRGIDNKCPPVLNGAGGQDISCQIRSNLILSSAAIKPKKG